MASTILVESECAMRGATQSGITTEEVKTANLQNPQNLQDFREIKSNDNNDNFDDELDENFVEDISKKLTIGELENTTESFKNPKGLEETTHSGSNLPAGPDIDPEELKKFQDYVKTLPR